MLKRTLFAAGVLAAVGLVACNSGGSSYVAPTPGPTCNPNVTSQLVYPASGATGVSPSIGQIVVAVSSPLPNSTYNLTLTNTANAANAAQTFNFLAQISASQLPAGSASTSIVNPTYEQVLLANPLSANFSSGTTIQTAINVPSSSCTPQNVPGGTFTLQ